MILEGHMTCTKLVVREAYRWDRFWDCDDHFFCLHRVCGHRAGGPQFTCIILQEREGYFNTADNPIHLVYDVLLKYCCRGKRCRNSHYLHDQLSPPCICYSLIA